MIEDYVRAHDEFLGYGVAQILNGLDKTGLMGNHDFLNLNNVLSISIVKHEV